MSLVDYGGRPVPNLVPAERRCRPPIRRPKQGSWNAAHFSNATYDGSRKQFVAAVDLSEQRRLATRIQTLLLEETPVIFPYFYDLLAASQQNVFGIKPTAGQQMYLNKVTKS